MKRSFPVALALAFSSQPAGAELLKNFRFSGQIDVQATSARNVVDFSTRCSDLNLDGDCVDAGEAALNDRIGDAQTRVMVSMDWDLLDDVHARITLRKNDRSYGNAGGTLQGIGGAGGSQPLGSDGAGTLFGSIALDEANFKIDKLAGQIDATMGRQHYGDSGDIVIYFGPSEKAWYGLPVTALDAGRFDWSSEWLSATGLVGKMAGSTIGTVPQPDTDIRGLIISLKGNENVRASLYGWNRLIHRTGALGLAPTDAIPPTGGKNDNLFVVGLKAKLAGGGFWLKGEFAKNFGENRGSACDLNGDGDCADAGEAVANFAASSNYQGWAALANTGFKAETDGAGSFTLWGELAVGSGRSNTRERVNDGWTPVASDYRPGSIYGRFAQNASFGGLASGVPSPAGIVVPRASSSLGNRQIWGGGIKMSPAAANKLAISVSWWDYRVHRFATVPGGVEPFNGNRHIGAEIDVDATWTHSENVAFAAGWGSFQPGGLLHESVRAATTPVGGRRVDPVTLAYFDVRVKF